jgi:hypothetical protein
MNEITDRAVSRVESGGKCGVIELIQLRYYEFGFIVGHDPINSP